MEQFSMLPRNLYDLCLDTIMECTRINAIQRVKNCRKRSMVDQKHDTTSLCMECRRVEPVSPLCLPYRLSKALINKIDFYDLEHNFSRSIHAFQFCAFIQENSDVANYIIEGCSEDVNIFEHVLDTLKNRCTSFTEFYIKTDLSGERLKTHLEAVLAQNVNLIRLHLYCFNIIDIETIRIISKNLKYLQYFEFRGKTINDSAMQELTQENGCKNLEYVKVSKCSRVSKDGIKTLYKNLPNLKYIYYSRRQRPDDIEDFIMKEKLKNLENLHLNVPHTSMPTQGNILGFLKNLTELELNYVSLTNGIKWENMKLEHLRKLDIRNSAEPVSNIVISIGKNVKELNIYSVKMYDLLAILHRCPLLEKLKIKAGRIYTLLGCKQTVVKDTKEVNIEDCFDTEHCKNLKRLELNTVTCANDQFINILLLKADNLEVLKFIYVSGLKQLDVIASMNILPKLRELTLRFCNIVNQAVLEYLLFLGNLQYLHLHRCALSEDDINVLEAFLEDNNSNYGQKLIVNLNRKPLRAFYD